MTTPSKHTLPPHAEPDIGPDQAWFSQDEWLEGEREASAQIEAGQTTFYEDEEALEWTFQERRKRR